MSATGVAIFSLASAFAGTYAWFAMNTEVSASGMQVKIAAGSRVQIRSCYAIRYDGNYGAIATNVLNGGVSIAMSEYDSIFVDRNVNTPMFLRMEIIDFDVNNDLTVTIPCTGNYKVNDKIEPNLSNVVSAKFMCGLKSGNMVIRDDNTWTGDSVTTGSVVSSYQGMLANASSVVGTPYVLNNSKQNSIKLTLPSGSISDFVTTRDDKEAVVAFVEFDYHVTDTVNLVSEYLESHGMSEHSLTFASDIQLVTLDNGGH